METLNISPKQYHTMAFKKSLLPNLAAAGPVSASLLSKVRNPLKFLLEEDQETTSAMNWGSLVDCLWTTPDKFDSEYAVLPEKAPRKPTDIQRNAKKPSQNTIDSIAFWDKWERESKGKVIIKEEELVEAKKAVAMLKGHPISNDIFKESKKQVVFHGDAPEELGLPAGTKVKSMLDLLPIEGEFDDCIVDLKTTNNLSESLLHNTMFQFDYVVKLSFYSILAEAAGYGPRNSAIIIWQNSKPPYEVVVREITDISFGKEIVKRRCDKLASLNPAKTQELYDLNIKPMPLKEWAINEYQDE